MFELELLRQYLNLISKDETKRRDAIRTIMAKAMIREYQEHLAWRRFLESLGPGRHHKRNVEASRRKKVRKH